MNEKIQNVYDKMQILISSSHDGEFLNYISIDGSRLGTKVSCSKYAKFLINDFKALENKLGMGIYTTLDASKIKILFSISDQYSWFSRKDLIDFMEWYCILCMSKVGGSDNETVNLVP